MSKDMMGGFQVWNLRKFQGSISRDSRDPFPGIPGMHDGFFIGLPETNIFAPENGWLEH